MQAMIGNCGNEKTWELINSGAVESYLDGRARYVTVSSIEAYIARQVAAAKSALAGSAKGPRGVATERPLGAPQPATSPAAIKPCGRPRRASSVGGAR
jgi:hypothetical protein